MATVTKERRGGNWRDTDRRVRHPLQAVRRYIRRYVILEGLGLTILYLSIAFWVGFAFDWGLFQLLGFDWIESFQNVTRNSGIEFYVRGLILTIVVLGLCAIAVSKTLFRLFGEFSDHSMALLLERRFPRQLGDRLMTAVELADPRISERYGFSLPLTEKTIREAAERVEQVPVRRVFNWARLRWIYIFCLLLTVGVYCLIGAINCLVRWESPADYMLRSTDAAGIWFDRNVLLEDIHWPREAHIEVLGFEPSINNKDSMRMGSGEQRADLRVRALKWIKGDRSVPGGWAPLTWKDLGSFVALEKSKNSTVLSDLMEQVKLENPWDGFVLDGDEPAGDWRDWSLDQIWRQTENKDVRLKMADLHLETQPEVAFLGVRLEEYSLPVSATAGIGLAGALPQDGPVAAWSAPVGVTIMQHGARIKGLMAGGPAEKAGLKVGDLITAVGDVPVSDVDTMRRAVKASQADKNFVVKVTRGSETLALEAGQLRDTSGLGLALENVEKKTAMGAKVTQLVKGGPAESAGFEVGDLIIEARGGKVADGKSLAAILSSREGAPKAAFKVQRGERTETLTIDSAQLNQKLFTTADEVAIERTGAKVTSVVSGGLGDQAGLRAGDVIVKAAGRDVGDIDSLLGTARAQKAGEFPIIVSRDEESVTCTVKLPKLPLEQIFDRLSELAAQPGMVRLISEKKIPSHVTVYWTDKSFNFKKIDMGANYRYTIGLGAPQQTTLFRVSGLDYYTPYKTIVVAPPPTLFSLTADRFEPAYVYYRLKGDQRPLKGQKRECILDELALTGISMVKVPAGSKVVLRAALADTAEGRRVRDVSLRAVKKKDRPDGEAEDTAAVPNVKAQVSEDKTGFTLELDNIDTTYDFVMEFRDEDRAVGQRRVRIEVKPDNAPAVALGIESDGYMRRARMRGKDPADLPHTAADAWLITPSAVLPLKGVLQDDFGLIGGNYVVHLWPYNVDFSLQRPEPGAKKPAVELPKGLRLPLADAKPFEVTMPLTQYMASFAAWQREQTTVSLEQIKKFNELDKEMMKVFRERKTRDAIVLANRLLTERQAALQDHADVARTLRLLAKMYEAEGNKDEAGRRQAEADLIGARRGVEVQSGGEKDDFKLGDVLAILDEMRTVEARNFQEKKITAMRDFPRLPTMDTPVKLHYMMHLMLEATDNNVETGPVTTRTRTPVKFIIVGESEFLAQVGEEEDLLSKRLDEAFRGMEKSRERLTELYDQLKNTSVDTNYEYISQRYTRGQRFLLEASALTRDVSRDYDRIEKHLEFNKSPFGPMQKKWEKVSQKISGPLRLLVQGNKDTGIDFPTTEAMIKRHIDFAEEQKAGDSKKFLPREVVAMRAQEAAAMRKQVQDLMTEMNAVLIQIQELVDFENAKIRLKNLADEEKARSDEWNRIYDEQEKIELKKLGDLK